MIKMKLFPVVAILSALILTACATKPASDTAEKEAPLITKEEKKSEPKKEKDPPNIQFAKELQTLLEKGDTKGAIDHFANIPKSLEGDLDLKMILGALYYSDSQFDNAISVANKVLEIDSKNMDALELISMANYAKGDKTSYSQIANKILKQDPYNPAINIQKAQDYVLNKKYKLARQSYAKALKGDPENEDAMFGYAQTSYYTDELKTSKVYFQKLIDKDPQNSAALAYMGKLAYNDENYLKAISYVEEALKYDPENYDYWMDYGTYLRYRGKFDDAAKAWEHAATIEPDYFLAYTYLAGIYDELEKFDLALKNYHKVIETNPNYYYAYESAAILEYHQKNYAEAIKLFNTAYNYRASDPKLNHLNWAYALMIAACYYKMDNPQGAKKVIAAQLKKMDYNSNEYAMVRFFGDTYSKNAESQLIQKINKESDSNIKGKMLFYMGLYCEIIKANELAKEYYGKVTNMQAPMFFEYRIAEWGLKE